MGFVRTLVLKADQFYIIFKAKYINTKKMQIFLSLTVAAFTASVSHADPSQTKLPHAICQKESSY